MLNKKRWIIAVGTLLVLLVVASTLAAASPLIRKAPTASETVIWKLSKAQVVDPGQTTATQEGTLTTGYTIEATAKSKEKLVPEGTFRLTLSAFSPSKDMPGQKVGRWYVVGKWSITDKNAKPDSDKLRHTPDVLKGDLQADLTFNPAASPGNFSALARFPMSLIGGRWGKGEGTFSVNGQLEGDLFMALERWPETQ